MGLGFWGGKAFNTLGDDFLRRLYWEITGNIVVYNIPFSSEAHCTEIFVREKGIEG
jgi:hypothetical protein